MDDYIQKQLMAMQKKFEKMMKEKDGQQLKELRDQRKQYKQLLKATEQRVQQLEQQRRGITSSGSGTAAQADFV